MSWSPDAAALMAVVGAACGLGVPALIARIPEPPAAEPGPDEQPAEPLEPVEDKEPYADVAALPGLRWKAAAAAGLTGGLVGAAIGWDWALLPVGYLVPVGVALAVVDWRTRLLPTKVIAPSYAAVVALCVLAATLAGGWADLARAGWGWMIAGGTFLLLWLVYPRGMGYGDVRLSGVLGIVLGFLGWGELLVGVYAGFLLGGLGGALLSGLRLVDRTAYPFGPFMLLGAVVGVLAGDWFAGLYTVR